MPVQTSLVAKNTAPQDGGPAPAPKTVRVMCLGPALTVRGGISTLVAKIKRGLPDRVHFRVVATYSRYTGKGQPQRGSLIFQVMVFLAALTRVILAGIFKRETIFHI